MLPPTMALGRILVGFLLVLDAVAAQPAFSIVTNWHTSIYTSVTVHNNTVALNNTIIAAKSLIARSSDQVSLHQPQTRTAFGKRAFSSAAPQIWNAILLDIRQLPTVNTFKTH